MSRNSDLRDVLTGHAPLTANTPEADIVVAEGFAGTPPVPGVLLVRQGGTVTTGIPMRSPTYACSVYGTTAENADVTAELVRDALIGADDDFADPLGHQTVLQAAGINLIREEQDSQTITDGDENHRGIPVVLLFFEVNYIG